MTNGKLIAFTGIDGAGKTTLIENIQQRLISECDISVCLLKDRKPFSPIGHYIKVLKDTYVKKNQKIDPIDESLLMMTELGEKCISDLPSLKEKYQVILSDRFIVDEEMYAYLKTGVNDKRLEHAAEAVGIKPEITIFLEVDPKVAFQRIESRNTQKDWKETQGMLEAAHTLYTKYLTDGLIPNCIVVDANKPQSEVQNDVLNSIKELLGQH